MAHQTLQNIVICGHGLALETTLAALSQSLPETIEILALELTDAKSKDAFYGNVASPTAYDFHLSMGLTEPDLMYNSDTSFAYGTHYKNWSDHLDWVQAYNLPFPIWEGVPFHHTLVKLQRRLEPTLVGAVCGRNSRFAHPPTDPANPLSRAEYGYQFRPNSISTLLKKQIHPDNIVRKTGVLKQVHVAEGKITSLELTDGHHVRGQLFIDASGHHGHLMESLENRLLSDRVLQTAESLHQDQFEGTSLRRLKGETFGWTSITTLRDGFSRLTVAHPDDQDQALKAHENLDDSESFSIATGSRPLGWAGNCVAIGHASYILEPLTPAPYMLLQRDIERLQGLIPHSTEMQLERKEFNRLRDNDVQHCDMFQRAFFETDNPPKAAYWRDVTSQELSPKLERKITQFNSRAYLAKFDLEPFNEEDWAILHFGMQRKPERYIDYKDVSESRAVQDLNHMEQSIQSLSRKVPPHDRYVDNFMRYLEKKM